MEHESFENEDIATVMNEHYINIKVDREERPDVDQLYMTFVQVFTIKLNILYVSLVYNYFYNILVSKIFLSFKISFLYINIIKYLLRICKFLLINHILLNYLNRILHFKI